MVLVDLFINGYLKTINADTQECYSQESQLTRVTKKKDRWGKNNDNTNATYETTDARAKRNAEEPQK